jgi:putative ABC transport system permease protein
MLAWFRRVRARWRYRQFQADLSREIEAHRAMTQDDLEARGLPVPAARTAAARSLGNVVYMREEARAVWISRWIESVWQDVNFAIRGLRRTPGFTTATLLTLALGLGANTAIFSVADRVLLHPLPLPDAHRLFAVRERNPQRPYTPGLSGPAYQQIASLTSLIGEIAAFQSSQLALMEAGSPELIWGHDVTPGFFTWLRARPLLGRTFTAADARADGPRLVILSYEFWQRRFHGDPKIIGRPIHLSNETFAPAPGTLRTSSTVIGVMPEGFAFPQDRSGQPRGFWKPVDLDARAFTQPWDRQLRNWTALVRLRPGVDPASFGAALDTLAARNRLDFSKFAAGWSFDAQPLAQLFSSTDFRVTVVSLALAVSIVLVLACANVANLLMTRAERRRQEFAIRTAIGAGQGRLLRQLLIESLLLAVAGGIVGWIAAIWGTGILAARLPAELPRLGPIGLDAKAFGVTLFLAVTTGVIFGLVPAWQASRPRLGEALKAFALLTGRERRLFRYGLVFSQVALSVVVLVAAGLLLRSVSTFLSVSPGYDPRNLATLMVTHFNASSAERTTKLNRITEAFRALPDVQSLAVFTSMRTADIVMPGRAGSSSVGRTVVSTEPQDFFATYRIPLILGRGFDRRDTAPGSPTVIVNNAMAREMWPNTEAVGQVFADAKSPDRRFEVVGVVGDVIHNPERPPEPRFYEPYERVGTPTMDSFYTLRSRSAVVNLIPAIRATLWKLEPLTIPPEIGLLEDSYQSLVAPRQTLLQLLGFFAITAVLLTSVGIYGVISQSVASRTREIGLRLALGAQKRQVFGLIVGQGGRIVALGIATGLLAAPLVGGYLESKLFGVGATDLATFAMVAGVMGIVGLLACGLSARRAMHVDPSVNLKST